MDYQIVDIRKIVLSPPLQETRAFYLEQYGAKTGTGIYSSYDWQRIDYVFNLTRKGGAILDVGVGSGQLVNTLARSGHYEKVVGVDIKPNSRFIRMADTFDMLYMSVGQLALPDKSFDTVICMEVLEHIDRTTFLAGLQELRRVCRGQLIMSVPFEEPEPLPRYHKQRFTGADIHHHWPTATVRLLKLPKPKVHWVLMEEYPA